MTCIDCGQQAKTAFTPLCDQCARLAINLVGSESARCALLGEEA